MKYLISILLILTLLFPDMYNPNLLYQQKCGAPSPDYNTSIPESSINNWLLENPGYRDRDELNILVAFHVIYANTSSNGGYISETKIMFKSHLLHQTAYKNIENSARNRENKFENLKI